MTFGLLAVAAVLWSWPMSSIQAQAGLIIVEGRVLNATSEGGSVEGTVVVLHRETSSVHDHVKARVDAEGQFVFEAIEVDSQATYGVSVTYQGGLFGVDLDLTMEGLTPIILIVYDVKQGDEMLSVSASSLLFAQIDPTSQRVAALEIVKIVNRSDRAYIPGPEPMDVLRFGLPPGAQGLSVETRLPGADFIQVDRGFALVATVPPGEHEVLFRYSFPYSDTEVVLDKSFRYGAGSLRILAPEGLLELSSLDLDGSETVNIGGRRYGLLQATELARGANVSLELTELNVSTPDNSLVYRVWRTRLKDIAPVVLGVFMAMVIAYAFVSKPRRQGDTEDPVG